MKKTLSILLIMILAVSLVFAGCDQPAKETPNKDSGDQTQNLEKHLS